MGLLDMDMSRPEAQGFNNALLGMAQALLTPQARGGGMGAAFAAFPQAIDRARQNAMREQLMALQGKQIGLESDKLGIQMDEIRRKAEAERVAKQNLATFLSQFQANGGKVTPDMVSLGVSSGLKVDDLSKLAGSQNWGRTKLENVNGVGVDPYTWKPSAAIPDPNKPFNNAIGPDGRLNVTGNPALQNYEIGKASAGAMKFAPTFNTFPRVQDELDKGMAKSLVAAYDQLQFAAPTLDNIEKAKELVKKSGPFVGSQGDNKLAVVQFMNNNLGLNIAPEEVRNASELRSRVFMGIMDNLKKMDAQPSQQQQQVMQDALGRITTDPGALPKVLDVFGDIVRQKVEIHNKRVAESEKSGIRYAYPIRVDIPPKRSPVAPAPSGDDPLGVRGR